MHVAAAQLSDFTAANGATHCIPGSNLWARLPPGESPSNDLPTVQAEMRRGSVILFTGSLIHAGGTNQTDMPRLGLALSYQAGFLRGETNHASHQPALWPCRPLLRLTCANGLGAQVLNVPPERARSLPIAVQELLGYPLRHSGNMMDLFGDGPYRGGSSYAYTGAGKGGRSRLVDAVRGFPLFVAQAQACLLGGRGVHRRRSRRSWWYRWTRGPRTASSRGSSTTTPRGTTTGHRPRGPAPRGPAPRGCEPGGWLPAGVVARACVFVFAEL